MRILSYAHVYESEEESEEEEELHNNRGKQKQNDENQNNKSLDCTLEPFNKGIHRALVTTEGDQKYHILSQVDIIKFLYECGKFGEWFSRPLNVIPALFESDNYIHVWLCTCHTDGRNKFRAIAVLDSDGTLIGNLSASDLCGMAVDYLVKTILRPAKNFLQPVLCLDDAAPVTAKMDDSLGSVVSKLINNRMHCVWIVDDQGKLTSLISLSDICRVFTDVY